MATIAASYLAKGTAVSSVTKTGVAVSSGQGILVVVNATRHDAASTPTVSGVTFNGNALTAGSSEAIEPNPGSGNIYHRGSVFYAAAPGAATADVVATLSAATASEVDLFVFVINSPNTTAMIGAFDVFANTAGSDITNTLSGTTSGGLIIDAVLWRSANNSIRLTAGTGQTELFDEDSAIAANWGVYSSSEAATSTTHAMAWSGMSSGDWYMQTIVELAEAAAADPLYPPTVSQSVRMQSSIASAAALNSRRYG